MNIFKVITGLTIHSGLLLLTAKQAAPRRHVLDAQPVRLKAFKFKAADITLMGVEKTDNLGMYEVIGTTQFKAGEVIGYAGDVNKTLLELLAPAGDEPKPAQKTDDDEQKNADKAALHAEIITAIGQLDTANPEHFENGKPLREAVSKVIGKKIKAADIEAAWAAFLEAAKTAKPKLVAEDLRTALLALDDEDDNNYEADTVTPKREVLAQMVGRDVSSEELAAAIEILNAEADAKQTEGGAE